MDNVRIAFVSIPSDKADEMAKNMVASRVAACVNVIPLTNSYYLWDDKVESSKESLLLIKTTHQKVEELTGFVVMHHPYDVPEIITVPVTEGLPKYIDWIIEEMGKGTPEEA